MHQVFRTLRFKLAALNLVIFGIILSGLSVAALAVRERYLREDFDERLVDRAESMVEVIELAEAEARPSPHVRDTRPRFNPFRFPGYYFQLRSANGSLLERSRSLGETTLPLSDTARSSRESGRPALETYRGDRAHVLLGPGGELRLLTLYHEPPQGAPFLLQVGVSLARVNESVAQLRRLFLFLVPGGLLAVGAASWLMARRSLAPIGRIAREARKLTAASLDQRVALPVGKDEVAELASTINEMLDRLERAFRAQERFIADASHELKTPLSVLLGEAQILLQHACAAEEYDRFVASVQDEMRQMAQLVDSLLILARADAGFPLEATSPVVVNEAVTDAVQRCEAAARQREIRLVPRLALPEQDRPALAVSGDIVLLRAMTENLIRNAIRHSPPEEVVEVEVAAIQQGATITVRDRGAGIPGEDLERVFERFYRVRRGNSPLEGAGLGLAIARAVAVLHGGSIRASNRSGGGCEFAVSLPTTPDPGTTVLKEL